MNTTQNILPYFSENESLCYQYDNHLASASLELDNTGQIIFYEECRPFEIIPSNNE